jgi:hypothetical protein
VTRNRFITKSEFIFNFLKFHSSGLDKKVKGLENEEELKKYIEERKK